MKTICLLSFMMALVLGDLLPAGKAHARDVTLAWEAPTRNTDGSLCDDLAGYRIYFGTVSGDYSQNIDVGNVTTHTITNLSDRMTYYFAVTAYDTVRNESILSNEVNTNMRFMIYPDISVTPLSCDFGTVLAGTPSSLCRVDITNTQSEELVINSVALEGADAGEFIKEGDTCTGAHLAQSETCQVLVVFMPASSGQMIAELIISSNDPDENPFSIGLSGTGEDPGDGGPTPYEGKMSRNSYHVALLEITGTDWIVRAYTNPTVPNEVYLEVMDTNNAIVPSGNIVGLATNPLLIANDAVAPEVTLGYDNTTMTAYVLYTTAGGRTLAITPGISYQESDGGQ